jgi:carboxypeptidase C (cathepsin A)
LLFDDARFPKYKPVNNKFSIWSESYGGHYAPTFADYFQSQNNKIASGALQSAVPLNLDTLGLVNACIDAETQISFYPAFAYNNTLGIQVINQTEYQFGVQSWPACSKLIQNCRSLGAQKDPAVTGTNADVNKACATAFNTCFATMHDVYQKKKPLRDLFDVASTYPESFTPNWAAGYLNTLDVRQDLGVPLNFSANSAVVAGGNVDTSWPPCSKLT